MTIAHEFHHAIQFGYYQGSDSIWWQESTSTWMEEVAYPEVDDYLQYLPSFLGSPHRALNSGSRVGADFHIYGTSIFSFSSISATARTSIASYGKKLGGVVTLG